MAIPTSFIDKSGRWLISPGLGSYLVYFWSLEKPGSSPPIWLQHTLVWTFYLLLVSGSAGLYDLSFMPSFLAFLAKMPLIILGAYAIFYIVLPGFWNSGQRGLAILSIIFIYAFIIGINRLFTWQVLYPLFFREDYSFDFFNWYRISTMLVYVLMAHGFFLAFKYYSELTRALKKEKELEQQKRQAELSFLRAQVHPHFLYNTLNALYNDLVQGKENASDTLLKLTEIYRFVLEESKEDLIPLGKELVLIDNYIDLEQKRYGDRLKINVERLELDSDSMLPPLILFSFVENSFKHGVAAQEGESHVDLLIREEGGKLDFRISNPVTQKQTDLNGYQSGIGLENTTRQLELIFGKEYELSQLVENGIFSTRLSIPLNDGSRKN